MDFPAPEPVIEALKERVDHGIYGYPQEPRGLKESVISWLIERHSWDVKPDDLIILPGVVTGFNLAAHAVAEHGDGVVIQTPCYGPFLKVADNTGLNQQEMELTQDTDGKYSIDETILEETITDDSKMLILCNPQNPTGRVFNQYELERVAEICLKNKIVICSDEIHGDLVYSGHKHVPIASLHPEIAQNTITLLAPSKTFNTPGLKASIAVVQNPELRQRVEHAKQGLVGWVNILGQVALLAAYRSGETWLEGLLAYLEKNRNYTFNFVNNQLPGIKMAKPEGTFLAWLDCRSADIENNPAGFFLQHANVALVDGDWFGKGGEGFVRLNFGCPQSILIEALNRMKRALP
jgi:cystathionine beta-lyase